MTDRLRTSIKASQFTESVIREMTRLANAHGAVNLSQGFPDFPAPEAVKQAACDAIQADVNQYAITWGAKPLREAIARQASRQRGTVVDPEAHLTVCCGSTEAMMATMLAIVDPGDEVIVFEPFYENYGPDAILSGATPRYVRLHEPKAGTGADWTFDPDELAAAFSNKTRAIIINTPNNPTGKVFTRDELQQIAALCQQWGALAVTDEIYEHIVYDGAEHVSMASLDGMADLTVTINSISKTYSVTGWRVGWTIASPDVSNAIRKVHDFLTVGAAAPLQDAAAAALAMPATYYEGLAATYQQKRDRLMHILTTAGFRCIEPKGAYYIMTDVSAFGFPDDVAMARHLVTEVGVASVPGSSFYRDPSGGRTQLRFCFCKKEETLSAAEEKFAAWTR
ncbi:MAG: aminotransferase class I/II-fold pyridoxal phosphate-dependent enzyme [Acidobacteria bacterium]|jgi:aspartate/methionine/tyrosine aminotransferase|nr:aminotransferase class I/II-fold pyridoxal phosphate-dependent enzyme [Acidobacteriota bacterium]